jgi:hypothetical protein
MTSREQRQRLGGYVSRAARSVRTARLEIEALRVDDGTAHDLYQLEVVLQGIAADMQCRPPRRRGLGAFQILEKAS